MTARDPGRYAQILDIARRPFARHGYRGTSLNMIAAEVGVSKAALYHHFPDKETLYRSLVATGMQVMFEYVRDALQQVGSGPRERLYGFMRASVEYHERYHDSRSEEHTSELQSLMRISYAVFCLKKNTPTHKNHSYTQTEQHP